MKTELVDIRGDLVALADDTFVVEEARTYRLRAPGAASVWLGEVALARTAAGHYEVVLGHYVGSLSLRLAAPDGSVVHHRVDVRPRTNKLPPGLWLKLLTELEAGLAGLSVGALGPTQGAVDTRGVSAPLLVSALLPLIPALIAALRAILDAPRWIDREHQDERQLHECRRIDSSTLAWIGRHPDVGRWLDGWRASELLGRPPRVPISSTLGTLDHPVNRTVAWLTHQVVKQLIAVADRLDELAAKIDDPVWCRGRATRARGAADQLCRLRDRSWLRGVPPEPPSEAAFLVLADDPTYARFHRIARRFCVPMFRLERRDRRARRRRTPELLAVRAVVPVCPAPTPRRRAARLAVEGDRPRQAAHADRPRQRRGVRRAARRPAPADRLQPDDSRAGTAAAPAPTR
jgi:hypothetical protein